MLKLGLIGAGAHAERRLLPALREARGIELVSVLSRSRERSAPFATRHGIPRLFDRIEDFLADDIDAVIVASPDTAHEAHVLACAVARKHVYCEKPLAMSASAAARMRDACVHAGVVLAVGYHLRGHPAHRKVLDWIRRGELGRVLYCRGRLFMSRATPDWRRQPGARWALSMLGTHVVDILNAIAGEVKDVGAQFASPVSGGSNEELATVSIRFKSGALGEIAVATVLAPRAYELEVFGENGYAIVRDALSADPYALLRDGVALEAPTEDPWRVALEDFAEAIQDGREPTATAQHAVTNLEILEACYRAAETGRREAPLQV